MNDSPATAARARYGVPPWVLFGLACGVAGAALGWRMWWGGPWMRITLVAATKSAGTAAS